MENERTNKTENSEEQISSEAFNGIQNENNEIQPEEIKQEQAPSGNNGVAAKPEDTQISGENARSGNQNHAAPQGDAVFSKEKNEIKDKIEEILDKKEKENNAQRDLENKSSSDDANEEALRKIREQNRKLRTIAVVVTSVLVGVALGVCAIFVDKLYLEPIRKEKERLEAVQRVEEIEAAYAAMEEEGVDVYGDDVYGADIQGEEIAEEDQFIVPEYPEAIYTVISPVTNTYVYENEASDVAEVLSGGTQITVTGKNGEYYEYTMDDGRTGYIYEGDVAEGKLYASYENAVDLRQVLPDSEFDILFANGKNITGKSLYPAIPLIETQTGEMIRQAEEIFERDGYRIKIYDAYRPKWAQYELYDKVQDNKYIANPYNGNSWHNLGRAVDMSLVNIETGEELEMPTPMHTFSSDAQRLASDRWTEEAKKNVDYMTEVMTSVGFDTIKTEWWHFENKGSGNTLPTQIDYTQISYVWGE